MLSSTFFHDFIKQLINEHIASADYLTLRQYCLDHRPIPEIIEIFNDRLSKTYAEEKEASVKHLTQEALKKQAEQDEDENTKVEPLIQEKEESTVKLSQEYQKLNQQYEINVTLFHEYRSSDLTLKKEIKDLDFKISLISEDTPTKKLLLEQKADITAKQQEAEKLMNKYSLECNSLDERKNIVYNLLIDLRKQLEPLRELSVQRQTRIKAREASATLERVLTEQNHQILKKSITQVEKDLKKQKSEIKSSVLTQNYSIYLECLNTYLQTNTKLKHAEVKALEQIIKHMQNYLEALPAQFDGALDVTKLSSKRVLLMTLLEQERQKKITIEKSELANKNAALEQKKKQLEAKSSTMYDLKRYLDKSTLTSIPVAGVFYLLALLAFDTLPFTLGFVALLMTPAILITVVGVGLFIADLIINNQYEQTQSQLWKMPGLIKENQQKIEEQQKELPEIVEKITLLESKITEIDLKISHAQLSDAEKDKADLFLQKARSVKANEFNSQFMPPPSKSTEPTVEEQPENVPTV